MSATITTAGIASEGGHWYSRDGKQVETVLSADGKKQVTPDIRHARKLGLLPGCTSIIKMAAAPGLEAWKTQQNIMSALTLPRRPHESDPEFIRRVIEDGKEQARKAAEEGTNIHAAIERGLCGREFDPKYAPHVQGVEARLLGLFGERRWVCEGVVVHPSGWGSKIDIESDDGEILVDLKSKDFNEPPIHPDKFHWDEHAMQLGAYREGRNRRVKRSANLFVSRTSPGLVHHHEWAIEDLDRGFSMFCSLLAFWKLKNRYDPSWA